MTTEAELVITAKERTKPAFNQIKRNLQMVEKQSDRTSSSIASIMNPLKAYIGFAGVRRLVTDFGSFDEALIKVGKTTNISGNELTDFGNQIKNLDIPVATTDLLKYAEAAGQLGVSGSDNLVKFVDTMARLEKSSDIVGEEGAKSLARILNVSGEGIDTVDTFGSVIVALGNNFAASESEILSHTTEVSRAIAVHKVGSAESAAFGVAMASLGIRAESGGSVVGRTFNTINKAIQGGGESLQQLISITGMTEAQLKSTFKDNAPAVFQSFLSGLNSIDKSGGDMIATLENLGLKGEEVNKTLPVMAKNSTLLANAMSQAKREVSDATALIKESNTAFSTMNADLEKTKKSFTNITSEIGERLSPAITKNSSQLRQWIGDTDDISDSIDTLSDVALAGLVAITTKYTINVGLSTKAKVADLIATQNKIKAEQTQSLQKLAQTKSEHAYALSVFNSTKAQKLAAIGTAQYAAAAKLEQTARLGVTASIKSMQVAQNQYNAVALRGTAISRGLSASMALLGGPAGAVILAAGALTYFISSSSDASEKAQLLAGDIKTLEDNYKNLSQVQIKGKIVEINQAIKAQAEIVKAHKVTIHELGKTSEEVWDSTLHQKVTQAVVLNKEERDKLTLTLSAEETETKKLNQQLALQLQLQDQLKFLNDGGKPLVDEPIKTPEVASVISDDPTAALKRQQLQTQYEDLKTALLTEDELLLQTATKRQALISELWQSGIITNADKYQELAILANEQYVIKLDEKEAVELARNQLKLERMDEQWLTESEKLDAQHLEELSKYQELVDKKLLTEQGYEVRRAKLKIKYKKAQEKLVASENKSIFSMTTGIFKNMAALQGGQSKRMFDIQKKASLANAAVTLPSAVIKAFENGGGLPWGLAPAAATLTAGLAQIQNIKKQNLGGSGSVSASIGGSSSQPSTPQSPSLPIENSLSNNVSNSSNQPSVINQYIFQGDVVGNDGTVVFDQIKEIIETTDAVLIEPGTRQAQELISQG